MCGILIIFITIFVFYFCGCNIAGVISSYEKNFPYYYHFDFAFIAGIDIFSIPVVEECQRGKGAAADR